jgi:hypothetical protein
MSYNGFWVTARWPRPLFACMRETRTRGEPWRLSPLTFNADEKDETDDGEYHHVHKEHPIGNGHQFSGLQ